MRATSKRGSVVAAKIVAGNTAQGGGSALSHVREDLVGQPNDPPGSTSVGAPTPADPIQVGYLASVGDRVTLARIYESAPPTHVGDLIRRLVGRILHASCPVDSQECAIRRECVNRCGAFDGLPGPEDTISITKHSK